MEKRYLSIDVGGTRLKYGVFDQSGNVVTRNSEATPANSLTTFLNVIFKIIDEYRPTISGIAISIPGKVNAAHSSVYHGGSLPYLDGLPLANLIKEKVQLPVGIENDGKCTALGEYWRGSLNGKANSAAIVLGTAVGGGLILDGHIRSGAHFQAGEISFMIDIADNLEGVMGDQCSAVRLVNRLADHFGLPDVNDGKTVFKLLAASQDSIAHEMVTHYCRRVAAMILNIQAINDLTDFVIGGGISQQACIVTTINEQYDYWLNQYPNVQSALERPQISAARLGNSANLLGALYSFLVHQNIETE